MVQSHMEETMDYETNPNVKPRKRKKITYKLKYQDKGKDGIILSGAYINNASVPLGGICEEIVNKLLFFDLSESDMEIYDDFYQLKYVFVRRS